MTKVVGMIALHYGVDFIGYAIKSVIDYIDELHVIYSPEGSHGRRVETRCPETEGELFDIASRAAVGKLRWHKGLFQHEGQQRDSIHMFAPDADVILVVDSDEVYQDGLAELAINSALRRNVQRWRLPFRHYWRSFSRCILHDPAYPVRVIKPSGIGEETLDAKGLAVNHFGYSIRPSLMKYKWGGIHGHQGELRKDCDWLNDVFMANRQFDTHPVGSEFWFPEQINPADYLPDFMRSHPFWGMEVIE